MILDNCQFAELRKRIDPKYNDLHDELTDCYKNGYPFRDKGVLSKEMFDNLHGLIFLHRDIEFHVENQKLLTPYPDEKYNQVKDRNGKAVSRDQINKDKVQELKLKGYDLKGIL